MSNTDTEVPEFTAESVAAMQKELAQLRVEKNKWLDEQTYMKSRQQAVEDEMKRAAIETAKIKLERDRFWKRLLPTQRNPLLALDVYKMGHMEQYVEGCNKVFSYLMARSDKVYERAVFYGLQYILEEYLMTPLEPWMADEFLKYRQRILGVPASKEVERKIRALCELGYWPLLIKAVPEGTVINNRNVLMTMTNTTNTKENFSWCVGFLESLVIKVWEGTSTATASFEYRRVVDHYFDLTVDEEDYGLKGFMVHDFGYRGSGSEESAAVTGGGHALSFYGSDTVPTLPFLERFYGATAMELVMASVPASEHSVMCSFGRDDELAAFRNMLRLYPESIVSIVSDTYNIYTVLTKFALALKDEILARPDGAKVVFRPDSGDPEHIICGDPNAEPGSPEWLGAIRLLEKVFGSTVNKKGFRVLNPKVGLIYGDGMYLKRYKRTLQRLMEMGYAASNLVIGVGGIIRDHTRDSLGFALKATYVEVFGVPRNIKKEPITDPGKVSHEGLVALYRNDNFEYVTRDHQTPEEEAACELLITAFEDGNMPIRHKLSEMRGRVEEELERLAA